MVLGSGSVSPELNRVNCVNDDIYINNGIFRHKNHMNSICNFVCGVADGSRGVIDTGELAI